MFPGHTEPPFPCSVLECLWAWSVNEHPPPQACHCSALNAGEGLVSTCRSLLARTWGTMYGARDQTHFSCMQAKCLSLLYYISSLLNFIFKRKWAWQPRQNPISEQIRFVLLSGDWVLDKSRISVMKWLGWKTPIWSCSRARFEEGQWGPCLWRFLLLRAKTVIVRVLSQAHLSLDPRALGLTLIPHLELRA